MNKVSSLSFDAFIFDENDISDADTEAELERFPTARPLSSVATTTFAAADAPPQYTPPSYRAAGEYRGLLLPRRIFDENQPTKYRLARPGELMDERGRPALLYDFWRTPAEALDEFGIGVSLYFRILRAMILIFLLCAGISILALYQNKQNQVTTKTGSFDSNGCLVTTNVVLPHVNFTSSEEVIHNSTSLALPDDWDPSAIDYLLLDTSESVTSSESNHTQYIVFTPFRILGSVYGTTAHDLSLYRQGLSDMLITSVLILLTAVAGMAMKHQMEKIDVSQQTTKDYSVVITNPPADIDDPQVC